MFSVNKKTSEFFPRFFFIFKIYAVVVTIFGSGSTIAATTGAFGSGSTIAATTGAFGSGSTIAATGAFGSGSTIAATGALESGTGETVPTPTPTTATKATTAINFLSTFFILFYPLS